MHGLNGIRIATSGSPGGPSDHSDDLTIFLVVLAIFALMGFAVWLGYRNDKAGKWNEDGDN